jgi:hypothetical protein
VQDFELDLAGVPPWPVVRSLGAMLPTPLPDRIRITAHLGAGLVELAGAWASQEIVARLAGCSLWWQLADTSATPVVTVAQGLPDAMRFADLLTGRW